MASLNQYFIVKRIKELKLTDEDFQKFNLSYDEVIKNIMTENYSRMFIITLSIILKCNIIDMFNNPDGSIF